MHSICWFDTDMRVSKFSSTNFVVKLDISSGDIKGEVESNCTTPSQLVFFKKSSVNSSLVALSVDKWAGLL